MSTTGLAKSCDNASTEEADDAPVGEAKKDAALARPSEAMNPVSVVGMVAVADAAELSIRPEDLAGNPAALKMVLTRAWTLESELRELKDSNAVLAAEVGKLRKQVASKDQSLALVRKDLAHLRKVYRARDLVGGIGLAALSAGIGMIAAVPVIGSVVAVAGFCLTLVVLFALRPGADS